MKIALVHDYIKEYGGAEKVLEALHGLFPEAPVFTSVYLPEYLGPHKERFADWDIRTSFLQNIPFNAKLISPFRLLSQNVFKSFDFSSFDIIITSSTGAYIPNALDKKNAKLLCYCHTPPRYLYGYATAREWKKNPLIRSIAQIANHVLRMQDYYASQHVDQYIANSEEVARRIKKCYRRDSIVVYPPAFESSGFKVQSSKLPEKNNFFFLAGGRLARPKHIDLIIRACMELGVPLKIFGKGFAGYGDELRELANESIRHSELSEASLANASFQIRGRSLDFARDDNLVEFVGEVNEEEKFELYRDARALLFASEDEDFGIMPVESMSAGTPVIAYRSGGVQETVVDGKTGLFYDGLTVESLIDAMKRFEKVKIDPKDCQKQAEKFSKGRFIREMKALVSGYKA